MRNRLSMLSSMAAVGAVGVFAVLTFQFLAQSTLRAAFYGVSAVLIGLAAGLTANFWSKTVRKFQRRRIFLAYDNDDVQLASELAASLRASGARVWLANELKPGDDVDRAISQAVRDADIIVGLVTSRSSKHVDKALKSAESRQRIVPVLVDGAELPKKLSRYQPTVWGRGSSAASLVEALAR